MYSGEGNRIETHRQKSKMRNDKIGRKGGKREGMRARDYTTRSANEEFATIIYIIRDSSSHKTL